MLLYPKIFGFFLRSICLSISPHIFALEQRGIYISQPGNPTLFANEQRASETRIPARENASVRPRTASTQQFGGFSKQLVEF